MSEDSQRYGEDMSLQVGVVWLNDLFNFKEQRKRLFKGSTRFSVRVTRAEVVWSVLVFIISLLFFIPFGLYVAPYIPGIGFLFHPALGLIWSLPIGWMLGRRVANYSPYRQHTGEGMGRYLAVQMDVGRMYLARLLGYRFASGTCMTWIAPSGGSASTEREQVEIRCIEWLGSAPAPYMPKSGYESVRLVPRGRAVSGSDEIVKAPNDLY